MLPEIGIVLGFYVLARLTAATRIAKLTAAVAGLVAACAIVDLSVSGLTGRSVATRVLSLTKRDAQGTARSTNDSSSSTAESRVKVARTSGGSIQTPMGYGIVIAKESTLMREWIALEDPALPIRFQETPGITTVWNRNEYSGEFRYRAKFTVQTTAEIQAFQARFLTFDVWGNHVQTLSYEEVADIPNGAVKTFTGEWRLFSENDAEKFYASIAYVSRARLKDGRVVAAKDEPVIEEARKFSAKFTAQDLEPATRGPNPTPGPAK